MFQKMKVRTKQKKSLLRYWLFSYFSILIIPIITVLVFGKQAFQILEREVSSAYLGSLKQIQYFVDDQLSAVQETAFKLTTNEQIGILQAMQWDFKLSDHYTLYNIQKTLKTLSATNSFIDGIYLYQNYNEVIISNRDIYQKENFDFANEENFQISRSDFRSLLTQKYSGEFLFFDSREPGETETHTRIIYALSLPLMPTDVVKINLFISIDWNFLNNLFSEWNWTEGNYVSFLTENDYELRSIHGEQFYHQIQYDMLGKITQSLQINGTDVILCAIPSAVADGTYFSVLPLHLYHANLNNLIRFSMICLAVCIVTGGILSWYYTKHNYRPIQNLLDLFHWPKKDSSKGRLASRNGSANELLIIQENIESLLENNQIHRKELDWSYHQLRGHILSQLMDGTFSDHTRLDQELERLKISFPSSRFFVIVVQINSYDNLCFDHAAENDEKDFQLATFIIQNITEELLSRDFTAIIAELRSDLVILLSSSLDEKRGKELIVAQMSYAKSFIEENFGISFSYAAGGEYEGYSQISQCYSEAQQVLEYQEMLGQQDAVFLEQIEWDSVEHGGAALGSVEKAVRCIQAEDFDAAAALTREIFRDMGKCRTLSHTVRYKIAGIICLYIEALSSLQQQNCELLEKCSFSLASADTLYNFRSPAEAEKALLDILEQLAQAKVQCTEFSQDQLKQDILRFVDQNLYNPNLTIGLLADHFHLSLSYASKIFKRYAGIGFLNYVHIQRVEEAKQLLVTTDMNLNAIAEKIGYYNDIALIRLFKKYTGVTPGKYRELHRK